MSIENKTVGKNLERTNSQEHEIRLQKVTDLHKNNIDVWPESKETDATCKKVVNKYSQDHEKEYAIAGRLITVRLHGKTGFATIQDRTGRVQIYIRKDVVGDDLFDLFHHKIDLGDIIWVKGTSFKTKMGEITLKVQELTLLSKCLHPLPEKFHGIADIEMKYRQRYLDLISSPESKEKFKKRSTIIRSMRSYLDNHEYMEVETPMLHPIPGGAAARPFVTHHNTFDMDLYLRIAPELYLKRLVIGGFEKVYEINRNFRNEGVSTKHNPEFTMLEFYTAHKDYHFVMDYTEKMLQHVVKETCDSMTVVYGDHQIDFEKPFVKLPMKDAVLQYGNLKEEDIADHVIDTTLQKHKITLKNKSVSWGQKLFALFEELVEDKLIQPTFITEYPIEVSPLAKRSEKNKAVASRFELFIAGMELGNGFNELNDPFDQAERFKEQAKAHESGDDEAHHYDADYIIALQYGLPPTVGVGVGIDRLTMLLTNTTSIKDVILFPTLKNK